MECKICKQEMNEGLKNHECHAHKQFILDNDGLSASDLLFVRSLSDNKKVVWSGGKKGVSYFINVTKTSRGTKHDEKSTRFYLIKVKFPSKKKIKITIGTTVAYNIVFADTDKEAISLCESILKGKKSLFCHDGQE